MKIALYKETVFAENLTYEEACQALEKADESFAGEFFQFSLFSKPGKRGWSLQGYPRNILEIFAARHKEFVIEI